uniref:ribosomal protein S8 n=1 Tax=Anunuuluaehu liula TaxID=3049639 RepID=UPI0030012629
MFKNKWRMKIVVNDTIADMLTRIRNANLAKHQIVQVPATKMTRNIIKVLREEGFIYEFEEIGDRLRNYLLISLKYKGKNKQPVITALKRVSKPGLRVYANHRELPKVLGGIGIAIISTSKGVMTDRQARYSGLGGEVLCYIW